MKRIVALAVAALAGAAVIATPLSSSFAEANKVTHRLVLHVDENDSARMNMALNNAKNVTQYYEAKGETVEIEIVAYGPGLHMLRADTSPVKGRISAMSLEMPGLRFSACGNTLRGMEKASGKPVKLVDEAKIVTSGVVRLIELQEAGWSYVRP